MAGISSKALAFGSPENKKKYNGIEKENDLQIEIYDAELRELDGQVGIWWQIDPKTENMEMWSPYASNYDNPMRYSDPMGDEGQECCKELWDDINDAAKETWRSIKSGASDAKDFGVDFYKKGVLPGMDWLNENLNPLVSVAEVTSGKSYSSNFTIDKSRLQSGSELAISLIPGGKVEGTIAKTAEKAFVKEGVEATEKQVVKTAEKKLAPTIKEQAEKLVPLNGGKNSVTIGTPMLQIRYDLVGKKHFNVPTPHKQIYNKNFVNGVQKSISRASKEAQPLTQQDIRLIRNYLNNLKKG